MINLQVFARLIIFLLSSISILSCAASSGEIAAAYISPTQYKSYDCDQLSQELVRLNLRKTSLAADIDKKAASDEGMTAVSALLFWPAAFAIGGNQAQEAEYARLKGEYDAVQQAGIEKNCNLQLVAADKTQLNVASDSGLPTSAIEFYGDAEEEVNTDNYDRNIWAMALVEVEGDESKRKAKYIELRAKQLYSEHVGLNPDLRNSGTSSRPGKAFAGSLTGTYSANITGKHRSSDFKRPEFNVRIIQRGSKITGAFSKNGKIWGDINEETVRFEWFAAGGWSGEGEWIIDPMGNELKGTWDRGEWNLQRIE